MNFVSDKTELDNREEELLKDIASEFIPPDPIVDSAEIPNIRAEEIYEEEGSPKKKKKRLLRGLRKKLTSIKKHHESFIEDAESYEHIPSEPPAKRETVNDPLIYLYGKRREDEFSDNNIYCNICGHRIKDQYISIEDDSIHEDCWRCAYCGDRLGIGEDVFSKDGK